MRKTKNSVYLSGRIYSKSDLEVKTVKNQQSENFGKPYIGGKLEIAIDEEGTNVITVNYTYVTPTTAKGGVNKTYTVLEKIVNEGKTWVTDGKDAATKIKLTPSFAANDFINRKDELIESVRLENGFAEFIDELPEDVNARNTFIVDMVINNVAEMEGNEDRGITPYMAIRGCVFNFKEEIIPMEFRTRNDGAMKYFDSLDASPNTPVFTQIKGIVMNTKVQQRVVEESAFGEAQVSFRESTIKENIVTWAKPETYEFDVDITADELKGFIQAREIHKADVRRQNEEYQASRAAGGAFSATPAPTPQTSVAAGGFSF